MMNLLPQAVSISCLALAYSSAGRVHAFYPNIRAAFTASRQYTARTTQTTTTTTTTTTTRLNDSEMAPVMECYIPTQQDIVKSNTDPLKRRLFEMGASYDRGFAAGSAARDKALSVIHELEEWNTETHASRGIPDERTAALTIGVDYDDYATENDSGMMNKHHHRRRRPTLSGTWRLIWTTDIRFMLLRDFPMWTVGAIYQVFEPSEASVTNLVEFLPRGFVPFVVPSTVVRAKVNNRILLPPPSAHDHHHHPSNNNNNNNRLGLAFESIQFQPVQVFGVDTVDIFPPWLGFDWNQLPSFLLPRRRRRGGGSTTSGQSTDDTTSTAGTSSSSPDDFIDVSYLDKNFMIVRQRNSNNAGGGGAGAIFCLAKMDDTALEP